MDFKEYSLIATLIFWQFALIMVCSCKTTDARSALLRGTA
jgi:hypothetical protein